MKPDRPHPAQRPEPATGPGLLRAISGLLIWSASFLALYITHAQGCELISPAMSGWLRAGLIALWALPLLVLGAMLAASARRLRRARKPRAAGDPPAPAFMARLTLLLDASSLAAVLAIGLPIWFVPVCTGPLA